MKLNPMCGGAKTSDDVGFVCASSNFRYLISACIVGTSMYYSVLLNDRVRAVFNIPSDGSHIE